MSLRRICDHCYQPIAAGTRVLHLSGREVTEQWAGNGYSVDYGPLVSDPLSPREFCGWPCLIAYARETAAAEDAVENAS